MARRTAWVRFVLHGPLLIGAASLTGGCDSRTSPEQTSRSTDAEQPEWELIVEPAWVEEHWRKHAVLIVDTRSATEYAEGHIPGAVNVPVTATYDDHPGNTDNIARVPRIEQVFGSAGISHEVPVILYDDHDYREAARVFWVLEVHGHTRTAVLNGGFSGWKSRDFPVTTSPTIPRPTQFIANLQPERMSSKLQVLQMIGDDRSLLLDARSGDEYAGLKNSGTPRAGHIPGAINLDFKDNLESTGQACRVRDFEDLTELYEDIPDDQRIVSYCTTGTHASVSYLVLRALGRDVAIYDGSWVEWSADPNLPIEQGPYTAAPEDAE